MLIRISGLKFFFYQVEEYQPLVPHSSPCIEVCKCTTVRQCTGSSLITRYKGMDPEVYTSYDGLDYGAYPIPRTITF